jgi:hypothetical protein
VDIVINRGFGGFSLSPAAVRTLAKLHGRKCFFFLADGCFPTKYKPVNESDIAEHLFWVAFDADPNTEAAAATAEDFYAKHCLEDRPKDRSDPLLLQVVKELGAAANGHCAELAIISIPDGVEYTIEDYDGLEHVAEAHRTWR